MDISLLFPIIILAARCAARMEAAVGFMVFPSTVRASMAERPGFAKPERPAGRTFRDFSGPARGSR